MPTRHTRLEFLLSLDRPAGAPVSDIRRWILTALQAHAGRYPGLGDRIKLVRQVPPSRDSQGALAEIPKGSGGDSQGPSGDSQ